MGLNPATGIDGVLQSCSINKRDMGLNLTDGRIHQNAIFEKLQCHLNCKVNHNLSPSFRVPLSGAVEPAAVGQNCIGYLGPSPVKSTHFILNR